MKKHIKIVSLVISFCLVFSVMFIGCSNDNAKNQTTDNASSLIDSDNSDSTTSDEASSKNHIANTDIIKDFNVSLKYQPLSGGDYLPPSLSVNGAISGRSNDRLLYDNPDRGFRTTISFQIIQKHPDPNNSSKTTDTCDLITRNANGTVSYNSNSKCKHDVRLFYCNLDTESKQEIIDYLVDRIYINYSSKTDYRSKLVLLQSCLVDLGPVKTLPEGVFEAYDLLFNKLRTKNCKVLFRLGYHGIQLNWQVSEANRQKHLEKGATEENMLAHIDQLAPFLIKNKDIIHKMSSGFIGSGGEMAYSYQYPVVNYDKIMKAIVEKICVPMGITYSVRLAKYKLDLLKNDPDYKYAHLIGYNNDGMFGETENLGWNSGCYQYNHNFDITGRGQCKEHDMGGVHIKNDWWEYVCQTAAYTPQSGEMFHRGGTTGANKEPKGIDIILECAHHRFTTMSHWNSYIEDGTFETGKNGNQVIKQCVMQNWISNETITPEILDSYGIIYDPAWFYDEDGNKVKRNPYEFIRDHLGYRLRAEGVKIEGNTVTLSIKNFGFAAAFNLESGFAILDENFKVVSEVKAGSPDKWYSHDPENWKSTEVLEHTVSAKVSVPDDGEKYYIAFYLRNDMNQYARLANDPYSVNFKAKKYNILYTVN